MPEAKTVEDILDDYFGVPDHLLKYTTGYREYKDGIIRALDHFYQQKYLKLLPEKKLTKSGKPYPTYSGFNQAIDQMRKAIETGS